jgi:hypothetical protein
MRNRKFFTFVSTAKTRKSQPLFVVAASGRPLSFFKTEHSRNRVAKWAGCSVGASREDQYGKEKWAP